MDTIKGGFTRARHAHAPEKLKKEKIDLDSIMSESAKLQENEENLKSLRLQLHIARRDLLVKPVEEVESLGELILIVLGECVKKTPIFLTPQEIAHRVGFRRPNNQAFRVNPTLHVLLKQGKIKKRINSKPSIPTYGLSYQKKEKENVYQ